MIWSDYGYLLSKNKFGENSIIAEFFCKNRGKVSGIIYGATSKKIKNYLQIGNKFHINYNSKNENKLGYLKIEIEAILTPLFFESKKGEWPYMMRSFSHYLLIFTYSGLRILIILSWYEIYVDM